MYKRNLLLVLILVMALGLSGCFSFLKSDKVESLTLIASRTAVGLADDDVTVKLTVAATDKKENDIVVNLSNVEFAYDDSLAKVEIKDGEAILTALKAGTVKVTATYEEVTSNEVEIVISEGAAPVIKTALETAITEAEALLDETEQGDQPGEAPAEAHTALEAAVTAATAVVENADATQAEVDTAATTLNAAIGVFEDAIVKIDEKLIVFEDFETDKTNFFSANYKSLPSDSNEPYYKITAGGGGMTFENGYLKLLGGRFTLGMPDDHATTEGMELLDDLRGDLDLSKPFKIRIEFTDAGRNDDGALKDKSFFVYLDNNTTSSGKTPHSFDSRIMSNNMENLLALIDADTGIGVFEKEFEGIGTANSFLQIRTESNSYVVLDTVTIEYQ